MVDETPTNPPGLPPESPVHLLEGSGFSATGNTVEGSGVAATGNTGISFEGADKLIEYRANQIFSKLLAYLLGAIGGALIATIWNLNSAIYEAVGKQSAHKEIADFEAQELQKQINAIKLQLSYTNCMNDSKVKDKSGCYKQ